MLGKIIVAYHVGEPPSPGYWMAHFEGREFCDAKDGQEIKLPFWGIVGSTPAEAIGNLLLHEGVAELKLVFAKD